MRKKILGFIAVALAAIFLIAADFEDAANFYAGIKLINNTSIDIQETRANGNSRFRISGPASLASNIGFVLPSTAATGLVKATNSGGTMTVSVDSTGSTNPTLNAVTGTDALVAADCGRTTTVTAGIDTNTLTLPEASTVLGCTFTISYIGADGGALVDISPLDSDADGIEGGCTLAASVVTFSGTADADIGLTKATGLTGDFIRLTSVAADMWAVTGCQGIWANN